MQSTPEKHPVYLTVNVLIKSSFSLVSVPIIDSVQTLSSDPSVREKSDPSANQRTPPPSQTEEKQCERLRSDHCESNSREDDGEDLIVKLEDEDDVQIVEQVVDSDHSANDGAGRHEMELDLPPAEVVEEQESQQWSSVSVGDSDIADDSDCYFEPKQLSQNLDSEILLIQNALDIFDNSPETAYSDRFMRDNGQGVSSKSRAPVPFSQAQPSQPIEAINHQERGVSIRFLSEKQPQTKNTSAFSSQDSRFFLLNDPELHKTIARRHIKEKWFICPFCGKSFGDPPANSHGRETVHMRYVRQEFFSEEQPSHSPADSQRGSVSKCSLIQQILKQN